MIRAKIRVEVSDRGMSQALVRSVQPDNLNMAGLRVDARADPRTATFDVSFRGRVETFISTLDDLLRCLQAAKGALDKISEHGME